MYVLSIPLFTFLILFREIRPRANRTMNMCVVRNSSITYFELKLIPHSFSYANYLNCQTVLFEKLLVEMTKTIETTASEYDLGWSGFL